MEQQSWDDGGTKSILPLERGKATFDVKRMMGILDGDPKATSAGSVNICLFFCCFDKQKDT